MCGVFSMDNVFRVYKRVFKQHQSLEYSVFPLAEHEREETRPEVCPESTGLVADLGQRLRRQTVDLICHYTAPTYVWQFVFFHHGIDVKILASENSE